MMQGTTERRNHRSSCEAICYHLWGAACITKCLLQKEKLNVLFLHWVAQRKSLSSSMDGVLKVNSSVLKVRDESKVLKFELL
jgi:hypothetical protein